jgi:Caspase domain
MCQHYLRLQDTLVVLYALPTYCRYIASVILVCVLNTMASYTQAQSFNSKTNSINFDFKGEAVNSVLPVIIWQTPALEFTNSQKGDFVIDVTTKSELPLKEITFQVIDGEKNIREKKVEVEQNTFAKNYVQPLHLQDGQYQIKIIAVNSKGGKVSSIRTILVGKDAIADAISIDRKDYAILFATDKYDYWSDLVNPVFDANTIANELKEKYGFEVEVVENASQEDVFNKLADYSQKKYKPQDQLLVFFAGHGYFDDTFGEGFVVAKNSLENDRSKTSYISHSRLRTVINNIPSEHVFLAMDVCFGGTFDPVIAKERGSNSYSDTNENEFLIRKLSHKTRKYMTSGGKTYVSDGIVGKHSPFAVKILQALKEGGGEDRILTLSEIKTYVEKLTPEPRFGGFGEDNIASDFVFVFRGN